MISQNSQISSNSLKLSNRQKHALPLIAAAKSVEEGCRAAGITAQTWYNWLKDAPFKAEVDRQREAVTTEALDRLKGSVRVAVECLRSLLDVDEKSIRLKACGEVLDYFMKAREIEGIERRLDEIERIMRQEEARERQR